MTIIIAFHTSNHRDFKNFYLGLMPSVVVPLCRYFTQLKGTPTGIEFMDSTSIKVCHHIRIPRHKVFDGVAKRGKGTMGWFYGFKLHLLGGLIAYCLKENKPSLNISLDERNAVMLA